MLSFFRSIASQLICFNFFESSIFFQPDQSVELFQQRNIDIETWKRENNIGTEFQYKMFNYPCNRRDQSPLLTEEYMSFWKQVVKTITNSDQKAPLFQRAKQRIQYKRGIRKEQELRKKYGSILERRESLPEYSVILCVHQHLTRGGPIDQSIFTEDSKIDKPVKIHIEPFKIDSRESMEKQREKFAQLKSYHKAEAIMILGSSMNLSEKSDIATFVLNCNQSMTGLVKLVTDYQNGYLNGSTPSTSLLKWVELGAFKKEWRQIQYPFSEAHLTHNAMDLFWFEVYDTIDRQRRPTIRLELDQLKPRRGKQQDTWRKPGFSNFLSKFFSQCTTSSKSTSQPLVN